MASQEITQSRANVTAALARDGSCRIRQQTKQNGDPHGPPFGETRKGERYSSFGLQGTRPDLPTKKSAFFLM